MGPNDPENLIAQALSKKLIPNMTKRYFRELQNTPTTIVVFVATATPNRFFCDIFTEKNIAYSCLLKTKTAHRFMRH